MRKLLTLTLLVLVTALALAQSGRYEVVLTECGPRKIEVIKVVRAETGLGLKDCKDMVESCPKVVKSDLERAAAEALEKKLEAAGARAYIRLKKP